MLKGIIFDMDGVMVDTEPLSYKAFDILLGKRGMKYNMDVHNSVQGCPEIVVASTIKKHYNLPETAEDIAAERNSLYLALVEKNLKVIDGLMPLLDYIKGKNLKRAVVTGTTRSTTEKIFKKLNIESYFNFIICGNEVKIGKPDPWVYNYTVGSLGLNSDECVILEDSINGITAGIKSGCKIIAVNSVWSDKKENNIIAYKDNLIGIDKIIEKLI